MPRSVTDGGRQGRAGTRGGRFGPTGELEVAVAETLQRWRARAIELPDYDLVLNPET
jgi:hypothetical protein